MGRRSHGEVLASEVVAREREIEREREGGREVRAGGVRPCW
jgi:hypothetical protein